MSERKILSSNTLKTIAFISMVIDHVGLVFFPTVIAFRIVGRLAFPIFAFMISEGARYTKNRLAYFLRMLICGILFNAVYYYFTRDTLLTWINEKGMPAHKVGRGWKYKPSEVDAWIKSGKAAE